MKIYLKCAHDAIHRAFTREFDMVAVPREEEIVRIDDDMFICVVVEHLVSDAGGSSISVLLKRIS